MASLSVNSSAIYAADCACQWHPLVSPGFQRPIDIGHVKSIQTALQQYPQYSDSIIKTLTIINDLQHQKLYILDGQHRYQALVKECGEGRHIRFAVQQVPGTYELAHHLYVVMETRTLAHDPQIQMTTTPDETAFVYAAKAYLRGLEMKVDGPRRPSVNVDVFFQTYQKTKHPQTLPAFKDWIEDRNTKIKAAYTQKILKVNLGDVALNQCLRQKYWFGLYTPDNYYKISLLT